MTTAIWQAQDFVIDEELFASTHLFSWRKVPIWLAVAVCIGIVSGTLFWNQWQESNYRSVLATTSQWITQESRAQSRCFQQATDATAMKTCAQATAQVIQRQQQRFQVVAVPGSLQNAAATMNNAFSALAAAACYDSATDATYATCLTNRDIRLNLALLNVQDALQQ